MKCGKLLGEELYSFNTSRRTNEVVKSRRLKWAEVRVADPMRSQLPSSY
jgi:hypothetical protein